MDVRKVTERLPGTSDQVRRVRSIIFATLGDAHPCVDEATLLASETATNAVRHSQSALPGGEFALTGEHTDAWARVTVRDDGSVKVPCLCSAVLMTAEHGRGVRLPDVLAVRWGLLREQSRNDVWFELGR
jgi:serine/threonine-protein kinase RsbW